ncbi:MAG: prephenate dehydrogenase/arogenate dehydrogenase family protein [Sulfuriflexus sp.]|nr:prephenate dehydrogenase/arogenate dehydrogenase family protein [Sulfuriflexus sp.]
MINKLCIIGVGLIGGSLARALKAADSVGHVVAVGRDVEHLKRAVELGVADSYETSISDAVADADMIVVAVPVGSMKTIFAELAGKIKSDAVITDVGSVKGNVVRDAIDTLGDDLSRFVPGHPIAGTEQSGVEASFSELYKGQRVILTPLEETDALATQAVTKMWHAAGADVESLSVEHHDEVLAATSHLPHALAYTLVDTLAQMHEHREIFQFAAGGFKDFTRIASSDPQMWHDICLNNRDALLDILSRFSGDLNKLTKAIENEDSESILKLFTRAKTARDQNC